ncbi:hypothetical protein AXG93_197s1080 [Marchantia polymorpha subsp. ruderalis]|uniref:Uncharacterized protein n=1 Tax=Marchantia polymorpha subsp. ruderalis TaxID=1480154 RepID=A0A176VYA3_MARPO|nr:hypothetical protein AXG93_197s1080 [Marchantia polymorpha subsp. ruderalis]
MHSEQRAREGHEAGIGAAEGGVGSDDVLALVDLEVDEAAREHEDVIRAESLGEENWYRQRGVDQTHFQSPFQHEQGLGAARDNRENHQVGRNVGDRRPGPNGRFLLRRSASGAFGKSILVKGSSVKRLRRK